MKALVLGLSLLALQTPPPSPRGEGHTLAAPGLRQVDGTAGQSSGRVLLVASYYAEPYHGRKTASGEVFNMWAMTAAHRTLPLGTKLLLEVAGKSVVVRITDRGPFVKGRDLDVSLGVAQHLGMTHFRSGTAILNVSEVQP